eukprot:GHUV01023351.1.p1 GENE.GHUV01023351.1~~GHUV01023351.1.p1  ORF type:complete len:294 (+),score=55.14 GHUV01023351.1:39-884(+)
MAHSQARQYSGIEASTSGRCHCVPFVSASARLVVRHAAFQSFRRADSQRQVGLAAARGPAKQQRTELPTAEHAKIKKSVYVSSSVDLRGCPAQDYPEFAVIGRSNVGKSSLINMLTQNNKLAKVSKEPGMTKTINHFLINDSWYLVDLPGYGFSKTAAKSTRESWLDFTKQYFLKRKALVAVLLLVDASIPPQRIDVDCANWLAESQVPFAVVFTKCDSRKKGGPTPAANMKVFKAELLQEYEALPDCFETSSTEGYGRAEVLNYLASLRQLEKVEGNDFL